MANTKQVEALNPKPGTEKSAPSLLPQEHHPILLVLGPIFSPRWVSGHRLAAENFAENPTSVAGSHGKQWKQPAMLIFGVQPQFTQTVFSISAASPGILAHILPLLWAHFSPLWLSKQKLAAQNFAENPISRAGSRGRMEFAENPVPEGRKTRNQGAPTARKMWNSSRSHPAS